MAATRRIIALERNADGRTSAMRPMDAKGYPSNLSTHCPIPDGRQLADQYGARVDIPVEV